MARKINCFLCLRYLGEIKNAKLKKEMDYVCVNCKKEIKKWKKGYEATQEILKGDPFEKLGIKNPFK